MKVQKSKSDHFHREPKNPKIRVTRSRESVKRGAKRKWTQMNQKKIAQRNANHPQHRTWKCHMRRPIEKKQTKHAKLKEDEKRSYLRTRNEVGAKEKSSTEASNEQTAGKEKIC